MICSMQQFSYYELTHGYQMFFDFTERFPYAFTRFNWKSPTTYIKLRYTQEIYNTSNHISLCFINGGRNLCHCTLQGSKCFGIISENV